MKFLKLTRLYPIYIRKFYDQHAGLSNKSYKEQLTTFAYDGTSWVNYWEKALESFGYECIQVLANVETLQKTWAKEQKIKYDKENWFLDIAEAQVKEEKPDILFVQGFAAFGYQWLLELRERCPSIKLVIGWCSAPYRDTKVFKAFDLILSCIPELSKKFNALGYKSFHINHAFDSRVLERISLQNLPTIDLSFTGSIARTKMQHLNRDALLERLAQVEDIHIFSESDGANLVMNMKARLKQGVYYIFKGLDKLGFSKEDLNRIPVLGKASYWTEKPLLPVNPKLKDYLRPAVFGLNMFQVLRNSKISLNIHTDISPISASNIRLFEATGVGTCLLTDWKENLPELFVPDKEVVTYRSFDECIEKKNGC